MPEMKTFRIAAPVQFDPRARHMTERQRRGDIIGRGNRAYIPVELRNGMPEVRPYVYRGAGYCLTEEEAASCLS